MLIGWIRVGGCLIYFHFARALCLPARSSLRPNSHARRRLPQGQAERELLYQRELRRQRELPYDVRLA